MAKKAAKRKTGRLSKKKLAKVAGGACFGRGPDEPCRGCGEKIGAIAGAWGCGKDAMRCGCEDKAGLLRGLSR